MINNFDKLENICKFKQGTYYKFVALIRKKIIRKKKSVFSKMKEERCLFGNGL